MISVCPGSWGGVVSAFRHLGGAFGIRFVSMEDVQRTPDVYASEDVLLGGGYHEYYDYILARFTGRKFFRFESPLTQMELSMAGRMGQPCELGVELKELLKLKTYVDE